MKILNFKKKYEILRNFWNFQIFKNKFELLFFIFFILLFSNFMKFSNILIWSAQRLVDIFIGIPKLV
jgi:hypothetical protein